MDRTRNSASGAGNIVQAGVVHGDIRLEQSSDWQVVPRHIPPSTRHFTGRDAELARMTALARAPVPGTATICAMDGASGVGKTALAVHWAHLVEALFPDGQIYIDLRGFDPHQPSVDPAHAIRMVLETLQVPSGSIPKTLDSRAALLRSVLHKRKVLLLIDNVGHSEQVRPLLPSTSSCFVLVTSRERLDGLVVHHGAHRLVLDLLSAGESQALLESHLGKDAVVADSRVTQAVVQRCARLPIALTVVAAKAALDHNGSLSALLADLEGERTTLDGLRLPGRGEVDVRLAISVSYESLAPDLSAAFRALALHPGRHFDARAAAAITGTTLHDARRLLGELSRRHLLECPAPGRFALHDLMRAFAVEKFDRLDLSRRPRTLVRMYNHYLHLAHSADVLINSHRHPIPLVYCARPELLPSIGSYEEAIAEFTTEYENFLAVTHLAQQSENGIYAWQLPWTLSNFQYLSARWNDWFDTHTKAVRALRRSGDTAVEARMVQSLGRVCAETGAYDAACEHYERALEISDKTGDLNGLANALNGLAGVLVRTGAHAQAVEHGVKALEIYDRIEDRTGSASTLNLLGRAYLALGQLEEAVLHHRRALEAFRLLGDHYGEAHSCGGLGHALAGSGEVRESIDLLRASVALHRAVGNRYYEAEVSSLLGEVLIESGRFGDGIDQLRSARDLLELVDDLRGQAILRRVDALEQQAVRQSQTGT